ncbi:hypothetical protein ANO14919_045760 [Xylariales sp. No.14919]|nr:hypothetical protein ANO14919_045760 [Xylariales sp. No.14919]
MAPSIRRLRTRRVRFPVSTLDQPDPNPAMSPDLAMSGVAKQILLSVEDKPPGIVGKVKAIFCEYQQVLSDTLHYLGININSNNNYDDVVTELHRILGPTYASWAFSVSVTEFTLALLARNMVVEPDQGREAHAASGPPQLQTTLKNAFSQILRDTIEARALPQYCKLKYEPSHQNSEKLEAYMGTLKDKLAALSGVLYDTIPMVAVRELDVYNLDALHTKERRLGLYRQHLVTENDLKYRGQYRAICKIIPCDKDGYDEAYGTGFLIDAHTVVTAAHNIHDHDWRPTSVRVHVGYWGNGNVKQEVRMGKYAAIHWGYYRTGQGVYDLAVIRVSKPFKQVRSYIRYDTCPINGDGRQIAIVGYPCHDTRKDMEGKYMYISHGLACYNLAGDDGILRHLLDTESGT